MTKNLILDLILVCLALGPQIFFAGFASTST